MTDNVTRGLGLLADEAGEAPINTDAVIAMATARTRNRAILATAFVTIFLVSALVLTLGAVKPAPVAVPPPTTQSTPWRDNATPAEQEARRTRLHTQVTIAFDRILPSGWQHSTFDFGCSEFHCWAYGDILDSAGTVSMSMIAWGGEETVSCNESENCVTKTLDDGTFVAFTKYESQNTTGAMYKIDAKHPDGSISYISAQWPATRTAPTLTDEQWLEFATAYSYF